MNSERIVAFAESLAQTVAAGGGPVAIAARLAEATGCAVLLEDARWHPIVVAESAGAPLRARAIVEGGAPGRALKVVAGETHLGWLALACDGKERDPAAFELLLRLASAAIAVELARGGDGARGARRKLFWERLLERAYHDAGAARDDALAGGVALASAYVAVALEPEGVPGGRARDELRAAAAGVFRSRDADTGLLDRGAALLLLVPAGREVDASNARTAAALLPKTVAKRHPELRFSGGVGTVETPLALHLSAERAEAALAIGRRAFGAGRVSAYDELGAYPLLYEGADVRRLQTFARRILEPLREYDRKHQTELERTLRLFFAVGQNVKTAAAELCVHRHTVFYRLRQIGEICGCSLDGPHDQLTLRLAVAIDALHSS